MCTGITERGPGFKMRSLTIVCGGRRPCVFGNKTMVKATAACLHRFSWKQNHDEGNGRLASSSGFGTKAIDYGRLTD